MREEIECPHCQCSIKVFGPEHVLIVVDELAGAPKPADVGEKPTWAEMLTPVRPLGGYAFFFGKLAAGFVLVALVFGAVFAGFVWHAESRTSVRQFVKFENSTRYYRTVKRIVDPVERKRLTIKAFTLGARSGGGEMILYGAFMASALFKYFSGLGFLVVAVPAPFFGAALGWVNGRNHRFPDWVNVESMAWSGLFLGIIGGVLVCRFAVNKKDLEEIHATYKEILPEEPPEES